MYMSLVIIIFLSFIILCPDVPVMLSSFRIIFLFISNQQFIFFLIVSPRLLNQQSQLNTTIELFQRRQDLLLHVREAHVFRSNSRFIGQWWTTKTWKNVNISDNNARLKHLILSQNCFDAITARKVQGIPRVILWRFWSCLDLIELYFQNKTKKTHILARGEK